MSAAASHARAHTAAPFRIDVAASPAAFAPHWPRLDRPGESAHYVFQTAELLDLWCATIGRARRTQPLFVRIADGEGAPLMLLALGVERRRGARVLGFLDGGVSDYNAPILFPGADALAQARGFWSRLLAALPPVDAAAFDKMPAVVGPHANPLAALAPAPAAQAGYAVALTHDFAHFAAHRLHRPKDSRRKRRRLAEAGPVRFLVAQTEADAERLFTALIALKTRRYLALSGRDGFERPGYRRYYSAATAQLWRRGAVHLCALEVGGDILAAQWGLVHAGRFYCLVLAYADAHPLAQYSPARLLVENAIEWSYAQGLAAFDLGVGEAPWKAQFAPERVALLRASLAVSPLGWGYALGRDLKARLKRAPATARRTKLPERGCNRF